MSVVTCPPPMIRGHRAAAACADALATQAAMTTFARGGNAVDAAIAANAVMAVVAPHLCGLGGDLFALVQTPNGETIGLNSSGRAGSGADPDRLRAAGHTTVPLRHEIQAVTVPGCVDGWLALHERFATRPLAELLAPAMALAAEGFAASPLLVGGLGQLDEAARPAFSELLMQATRPGAAVRRPGVALTLGAIATNGRRGFYQGAFGDGLLALGDGLFNDDDLATSSASWVTPLRATAFGVELSTIGPNSQGYLALAIAAISERAGIAAADSSSDSAGWPHLLVEAAKVASHDRGAVLHEDADGDALVAAAIGRAGEIDPDRAGDWSAPTSDGDTTYLCTADRSGFAVSLIQSNAGGFGSWIVEPTTGINLHNRGLGFSLAAGHPAELAPGRRPPHTLLPAMAHRDGRLCAVFGTMGGDAQPIVVAQLAARLFAGRSPRRGSRCAPVPVDPDSTRGRPVRRP